MGEGGRRQKSSLKHWENGVGGGVGDNEEVTVLHLEHEVKKVCFGREVLGRFDPKPQSRAE